jgi:hypothetical protein
MLPKPGDTMRLFCRPHRSTEEALDTGNDLQKACGALGVEGAGDEGEVMGLLTAGVTDKSISSIAQVEVKLGKISKESACESVVIILLWGGLSGAQMRKGSTWPGKVILITRLREVDEALLLLFAVQVQDVWQVSQEDIDKADGEDEGTKLESSSSDRGGAEEREEEWECCAGVVGLFKKRFFFAISALRTSPLSWSRILPFNVSTA